MKKIICFSGGTAMPKVILEELKKHPVQITTVTSMTENGGSTGQLREDFNISPAGDISRHLVALSNAPEWKKKLFYLRFGREKFPGGHVGHRFGTIFLSLTEYVLGDFEKALKEIHQFLEIKNHKALPATLDKVQLCAKLENGDEIVGEDEIDVPKKHNPNLKINEIYLKPRAKAYPKVLDEIKEADMLVFGPGDFYSSIISCFLPEGMKEAIQETKAKKVFICPLMTKLGETQNFSVMDFTQEIEKYIGGELDFVIFNNFIPEKERVEKYQKEEPQLIEITKFDGVPPTQKFIGKNLLVERGPILHHPGKVIEKLLKLCKQ